MKDKKRVIRQFIFILVVGLAVFLFNGEYEWTHTLNPTQGVDLETALSYLNLILPFLALVLGLGVFLYLRIRENRIDEEIWKQGETEEEREP